MGRIDHQPLQQPLAPDLAVWRASARTLRHAAEREDDGVARQTLLTLAADCDALAAEHEASQQPGKPKPPGNPPTPRDGERPTPVEEPPQPIPPPLPEPPPAPLSTRK